MNRVDATIDSLIQAIDRTMEENAAPTSEETERRMIDAMYSAVLTPDEGRAALDRLIRSHDPDCSDCHHKVSAHGPNGCEEPVPAEQRELTHTEPCGCRAWTTEFDKEAHENRYGG
jgi:hypothetical protein